MFVLLLNDMRSAKVEMVAPVARSESRDELMAFMSRHTVEPYRDGRWYKTFRQGSILEWFNTMDCFGRIEDMGTENDWIEQNVRAAVDGWREFIKTVPDVRDAGEQE